MLDRFVRRLESCLFGYRRTTLLLLAACTLVMGFFATRLHMSAGFEKQLPLGHEYTDTFIKHRDTVFGANRVIVVLHARKGDIWTPGFLKRLNDVTQALMFLPGVDRRTVSSLWTPNTRVMSITEQGFQAHDVIGGNVTPDSLDATKIARIRDNARQGGYVGSLVANDGSGAMVTADLLDVDPLTRQATDYLALGRSLDSQVRARFEDDDYEVQIVGFARQITDVADGAKSVLRFFALAFALTALSVYIYCRSWTYTAIVLICSLVSLVWQFGTLSLLGYGLDPLAVLVPFLVFAIGVSHGVQQINGISRQLASGDDGFSAARSSFRGLLVPGAIALITAFVGFATLMLIPIPMIRELAITASIGVAYKIVTNLMMLPVLASFVRIPESYVQRIVALRERRERIVRRLAVVSQRRWAIVTVLAGLTLFGWSVVESHGRHIGHLQPGAPELRPESRYNRDAAAVAASFSLGLDVFTIVAETPSGGCYDFRTMAYLDELTWAMDNVPGVVSASALPTLVKLGASGFNEGNPKWAALPRDRRSMASFIGLVGEGTNLYDTNCTALPLNLYLADHKATTIKQVVEAAKAFRDAYSQKGIHVALASGNAGLQAATNEVLESTELPMMLYVYGPIVCLVMLAYRDWRATVACCAPLTLATFLGYAFMKQLQIGLTVATLPVMVLAVGVGVDYAFYIYNQLQAHLSEGDTIEAGFSKALSETGNATIFTALTLAVGVATWAFSELKFQADMGLLLSFMFILNMVMAMTLLPALAVVIELVFPRRGLVSRPMLAH